MPEIAELRALGCSGIIHAKSAWQAGIAAMSRVLSHPCRDGSLTGVEDQPAGFEERQRRIGKPLVDRLARRHGAKVAPDREPPAQARPRGIRATARRGVARR